MPRGLYSDLAYAWTDLLIGNTSSLFRPSCTAEPVFNVVLGDHLSGWDNSR